MIPDPDPHWRKGMVADLLSLYGAARLDLRVRHIFPDATPEQLAELRRPGLELFQALFTPGRTTDWRCSQSRRPGEPARTHAPKMFAINDKRLVVVLVERPPRLPSGWRPERWGIIDLRLLAAEGHDGIRLDCPYCRGTHYFGARRLRKRTGTCDSAHGLPPGSPTHPDYPDVEEAAFVEVWGPYEDLETELTKPTPELYVYLIPRRRQQLKAELAEHPGGPIHPVLLGGPALRTIGRHGEARLQPGISPFDETQRIWEQPS